jgi:hypothetical protein
MIDWYNELKRLNGQKCYTVTQNKPATTSIDDIGVTIVYPSGNSRRLPHSMINEAVHRLQIKGILTREEVHEEITNRYGPQTDRLIVGLRALSGVILSAAPRALYLEGYK